MVGTFHLNAAIPIRTITCSSLPSLTSLSPPYKYSKSPMPFSSSSHLKHKQWPHWHTTPPWEISFWFLFSCIACLPFPSQLLLDLPLLPRTSESLGLIGISSKSMEGGPSNLSWTRIQVIIYICTSVQKNLYVPESRVLVIVYIFNELELS